MDLEQSARDCGRCLRTGGGKGRQYVGRAYVVNDWYIAAYEPIKNITGQIIGILYVGILEQKYSDINNRSHPDLPGHHPRWCGPFNPDHIV